MTQRRTNKGQVIDFDLLRASAEESARPAVGNMGTDAKGNKLGKGGRVVMSNEERVRRYYSETKESVAENTSIKGRIDVDDAEPTAPLAEVKTAKTQKANKKTVATPEPLPAEPDEFDAPDGVEPLGFKEVTLPNGDIEMVPYYNEEDSE